MMRRADWGWALLVIVIWGVNFVPMKLGLQELSPLLLSAMRFCLASLPFLLFIRKPASLTWRLLALYGLVQGVGQFGLLFAGLALGMPWLLPASLLIGLTATLAQDIVPAAASL